MRDLTVSGLYKWSEDRHHHQTSYSSLPHGDSKRKKMICRTLLVITLTSMVFVSTTSTFKVNVTQSFYQAEENNNITLEWKFTTRTDKTLGYISIDCFLITDHKVIFDVYDGVEVPENQDEQFLGRVQNDKDGLKEGRIRIQISRLRTNDSGRYRCEVTTDYGCDADICQLNVTAADQLQPHTSALSADSENPECWGRTCLHLNLGIVAAVSLVMICVSLICRENERRQNLMSMSRDPSSIKVLKTWVI